jgi:hypothetical protein
MVLGLVFLGSLFALHFVPWFWNHYLCVGNELCEVVFDNWLCTRNTSTT